MNMNQRVNRLSDAGAAELLLAKDPSMIDTEQTAVRLDAENRLKELRQVHAALSSDRDDPEVLSELVKLPLHGVRTGTGQVATLEGACCIVPRHA